MEDSPGAAGARATAAAYLLRMSRRTGVAWYLAVLGAVLLGQRLAFVDPAATGLDRPPVLRWAAFGRTLPEVDRNRLLEAYVPLVPWLRLALAVPALALGLAFARRIRVHARLAVAVGLAASIWLALDPGLLGFVVERSAVGAETRLDATHALRGLGAGLVALAVALGFPGLRLPSHLAPRSILLLALGLVLFAVCEGVARGLLGGEPLTNDGRAYLFQAELFARGAMTHPGSAFDGFFSARQVYFGERVFSKYPPGHSLLLAPGVLVGWPRLVPALLLVLLPTFAHALARRLGCPRPGLATWLFCLSPMVLGVEALFLSHASSLPLAVAGLAAALAAVDAREADARGRATRLALAAGLALSLCVLARPGTGAVLVACLLVHAALRLGFAALPVVAAATCAALPAVAFFLAHNLATTGSALDTAYGLYAREVSPNDRWGWINRGTAVPNTLYNLSRLDVWLLGLAPALALVALGADRAAGVTRRGLALALPTSLVAFHAFLRFHGVPWAGPLYVVEGLVPLCVLAAGGLTLLSRGSLPGALGSAALAVPLASALLLSAQWASAAAEAGARRAPSIAVREAGVERGVVFVALEREVDVRRHHLAPPLGGEAVLLARDRGAENRRLLEALGDPPGYLFDPVSGVLRPLEAVPPR